ncbi:MAG: alpha-N-arabinofuranosidase [Woeseia sp.]
MTFAVRLLTLALAAILSIAAALGAEAQTGNPVEVSVTIHADRPGAKINRNIYGQFAEHLGHGIYEGVWVGEDSGIPHTRGYRNDVVEALKKLRVPLVRWPGGCFADEYHWRDGIGPRGERPVRINTTWGGVEEPNAFGTHEFLDFAELLGADAYVAGNVGTGSPQEMAEWVEYITSDTKSTLAELRRRNGRDKPWRLPYFGVGNENWGCGGDMRPEYYTDLYRRFATFIDAPRDNEPVKIAGGANSDDYHWTEVMMSRATRHMDAYSIHYYTFPGRWENKGLSTGFGEDQWASTLKNALRMDELVTKHSAIMDKYDPEKRVGLYVDEWGTWYDPAPGRNPGFLWQQNTLRDALVAASTLDIFHRHADRVQMSAIAQMVNVLQAMILTDDEEMILTPTYYVFEMYIPFQDATSLPAEFESPEYRHGDWVLPAVDVSAARAGDGRIHVAFVNLDPDRAASVSTRISGVRARAATGRILTAPEMDTHNTFDSPNAIEPEAFEATRDGDALVVEIPPKAIVVVAVEE